MSMVFIDTSYKRNPESTGITGASDCQKDLNNVIVGKTGFVRVAHSKHRHYWRFNQLFLLAFS
jgi:hypothetical protein